MRRKKNGFTLIELLVVIAIMLSILGIAIVSFINISNKKKEEAWQLVKEQIETAATEYLTANEYLFEGLTGDLTGYISVGKLVEEDYLNKVTDPRSNKGVSNKTYVEIKKNKNKIICKYNESENNRDINQNEYVIYVSEIGAPKISVSMPNNDDENLKINNGWYNEKTAPDGVVFSFSFGDNNDEVSTDKISVNSIETTEKPLFSSDSNLRIYESINGETKSDITDEIGYYNTSKMSGIKVDFKRILNIQGKNTVTYTVTKNGKSSNYTTEYKLDNIAPSINSFNVTGNVNAFNDYSSEVHVNEKGFFMGGRSPIFPDISHLERIYLRDISVGLGLKANDKEIVINETKGWSSNEFKKSKYCKYFNSSYINEDMNENSYIIGMKLESDPIDFLDVDRLLYGYAKIKKLYYDKSQNYNGNMVNISGNINDGESGIESKEITYSINDSSNENNYFASIESYKINEEQKKYLRKQFNSLNWLGGTKIFFNEASDDKVELIPLYIEGGRNYGNIYNPNGSITSLNGKIMFAEINYYKKYDNCGNLYELFNKDDDIKTMREKVANRIINNYVKINTEYAKNIEKINEWINNFEGRDFKQKDIYIDKNAFPDSGYFELNPLKVDIPIDKNENKIKFKLKLKDKAGNVSEKDFMYYTYATCRPENIANTTDTLISNNEDYVESCTCECTGTSYIKTCKVNSTDTTTTYDRRNGYVCSASSTPSISNVNKLCNACPPVTNPNIEVDDDIETGETDEFDSNDEQEMLESFDGD